MHVTLCGKRKPIQSDDSSPANLQVRKAGHFHFII